MAKKFGGSEATKEKVRQAHLEKAFGLEQKETPTVPAPRAVPEAFVVPQPPTATANLAIEQPVTTKEHDLAIRGIPESQSKAEGFVEPPFDGLYWKQDGSAVQEDGTKTPGWYTLRMWDGSYNVIEER